MIRVDETDPVGEIEPSFPYRDVTVRKGVDFKVPYDIQSEIGRGKFGTVYRCKEKKTGLTLAAKVVNTSRKEDRRSVEREVEIMRRLQHPRLIQLYDAIDNGKQFYVILELIEGGELFERVIDDDFVLTERSCAVFLRQICEGVEFVHAQNILHLDMKPENILCLTKEGNRIKIIDFGLARHYDPKKKLQVLFGTPEFVAPEVVNFDQIGFGTDMWSIGVICYVLLSGLSPFMGDTDIETMGNVTIAKYDFDHEAFADISEDAKDFIRCLLVKDIEKRASAAQCREHRWLSRRASTTNQVDKKCDTNVNEPQSSQAVQNSTGSKGELDVTKDNLRQFVERWREHPDSPYVIEGVDFLRFELEMDQFDPNVADASLRGQSPSPCGSICSTASESTTGENGMLLSVPDLHLALERRASEGRSTEKKIDPASQIILADEIIRLSEHLRTIAAVTQPQIMDKIIPKISKPETSKKTTVVSKAPSSRLVEKCKSTSKAGLTKVSSTSGNEISEKLSNITKQRQLNGTTFHRNMAPVESSSPNKCIFSLKKSSQPNGSIKPIDKTAEIKKKGVSNLPTNSQTKSQSKSKDVDLTPPWRNARVKRRFGETCRDVPRIANLKDLHQTLQLDEPATTKNILLKLINEWGDISRPGGVGRKSVSIDWSGEESLVRKSMNSLAEYFQSEQQKAATIPVPNPVSAIHR